MFSSSDFSLGRGRNTSPTAVVLSSEEFFGRHGDLNGLSSCETQSTPDQRAENCPYLTTLILATALVVAWAALCAI